VIHSGTVWEAVACATTPEDRRPPERLGAVARHHLQRTRQRLRRVLRAGEAVQPRSRGGTPTMKVLGSDFYWNTLVEKDGVLYRLVFDSFTKRTKWEKVE